MRDVEKKEQTTEEQKILAEELHAPKRKRFPRMRTLTFGINDLWQSDLVDMQKLSRQNGGYKYILMVIDTFSKRGWARPLKSKHADSVVQAFESVLKQASSLPRVKNLQTDDGKEYMNSKFKTLMKEYGINHYSTFSQNKAAICERWNRTIKEKMWRKFDELNTKRWLDFLPDLIEEYNNSKHRTIKMVPNEVTSKTSGEVLERLSASKVGIIKPKFQVGDVVRLSNVKHIFEKGYTANWSEELFRVTRVRNSVPATYNLKDLLGEPMMGRYYEHEMKKTRIPDYFRIEKVLKKRHNPSGQEELFVKWKGHDPRFNSWILAASAKNL